MTYEMLELAALLTASDRFEWEPGMEVIHPDEDHDGLDDTVCTVICGGNAPEALGHDDRAFDCSGWILNIGGASTAALLLVQAMKAWRETDSMFHVSLTASGWTLAGMADPISHQDLGTFAAKMLLRAWGD